MIEPEYYSAWFSVIDEAKQQYQWPIPTYIEQYISAVLANYTDKPDWQPQSSWAETLLSVQTVHGAKVLGDQALFAAAVFPNMLEKHGIKTDYLYHIGQTSYGHAQQLNYHLFNTLSRNFIFLAECMNHSMKLSSNKPWLNKDSPNK